MKMTVFRNIGPCSLVGVDRRSKSDRPDDGGSKTSVNFNVTKRHYTSEDSKLQTRTGYHRCTRNEMDEGRDYRKRLYCLYNCHKKDHGLGHSLLQIRENM
jgi:hypothetical protein